MASYYVQTLKARGDYWGPLFGVIISGAMIGLLYGVVIGSALTVLLDNQWFIEMFPIVGVVLGVGWWSYNKGLEAGVSLENSLRRPSESQQTALDHYIETLERGEKEGADYWWSLRDREQRKRSDKV